MVDTEETENKMMVVLGIKETEMMEEAVLTEVIKMVNEILINVIVVMIMKGGLTDARVVTDLTVKIIDNETETGETIELKGIQGKLSLKTMMNEMFII